MPKDVKLKMTGERVVPHDIRTIEEHTQYLRHLFVYEHVKGLINPSDSVLEIGFGEGYGTRMIADKCSDIVGIDIMQDTVDYANEKYGDDKCKFQWYEGKTIPYDAGHFDVVISFQVIEHIVDDTNFVAEIYRVLKNNGRCFIATPNGETRLKPNQKPWNRFHIREYSDKQLAAVLGKSFQKVDVFGLKASDEIMKLEFARIHRGPFISLALKLGLRRIIPQALDPYIARFMGILKGQKKINEQNQDFKDRLTIKDFWLEKDNVPSCLDLFSQCVKLEK